MRHIKKGTGSAIDLKLTDFEIIEVSLKDRSVLWAAVWTVAAFLIAISPLAQSWLVFIPMVILYVLIVRALTPAGEQLDDTGYILRNAPLQGA